MADYKEIKGKTVLSIASDLDNAEGQGQIWFNTTSEDFKTIVKVAGSWSTGGAANNPRGKGGGAGIQTAAAVFGGVVSDTPKSNTTEEYDGSSWTNTGNLNTGRHAGAGFGVQTAAFYCAGESTAYVDNVESYNGSTWTETTDINTARGGAEGNGTTTAGMVVCGAVNPPNFSTLNEQWNGSAWSEGADTNTGRNEGGCVGTSTAALYFGGFTPGLTANSEEWNGTAWAEGNNVNRVIGQSGDFGIQTSAIAAGGSPGDVADTEEYNGTSWAEVANLSTARNILIGNNNSTNSTLGVVMGGDPGVTTTEEWNFTSTLQTGAWASGGNLPNPASTNTGFGPGTAGVHAGGELSGASNAEAFHYDGSSWTAGGNINTNRNVLGGYGTQTAGAIVGGHHPDVPGVTNVHETYDGSSWTEAGDLNTGRAYFGTAGCGTTTAALVMAGLINPELAPSPYGAVGAKNESEEYNGTSWTEGDNVNTAREAVGGAGTQTAGLLISGNTQSPNALKTEVEAYDGTSWTEVGDVNSAVDRIPSQCGGTQDIAIKIAGRVGLSGNPATANVEQWDGTAWAEVANVSTARFNGGVGSAPSASSAFFAGGTPPASNSTEEWTLAQNIKTITD